MKPGQNTFVAFLDLLKVKHTKKFSNAYFNEHPHKYNLFGLSKMLSDYGVENAGTRIVDKENDLFNIQCPFVAHTGSDFAVVYKIEADKVHYLWNSKKIELPVEKFIQSWSGVVLLAETTSDSIEPNYREHRKKELWGIAQKVILTLAVILIFGIAYINRSLYTDFGISLLLLINLIGVYICYLLVLKQLHIHSQYADKICSLFKQSDCNNVLESEAAKLWGVFGWSEIGLGYFVANVLLLLFLPQSAFLLALINIIALPYSFWSVWYQKVKARQWCPLCLIVQVLLWSLFILNCLFGYIQIPAFDWVWLKEILFIVSIFAGSILGFNLLIPNLSRGNGIERVKQEINSLKANEAIFEALLAQQTKYEVSHADSQILFGNPNAGLQISILTNPFCNPCARMHKRVEQLLRDTKGDVCVQYILSSFNADLEYANRYLIAAYLKNCHCGHDSQSNGSICHCGLDPQSPERIFTNWFEKGKSLKEAFFSDMQLDMTNPAIETEFQKHEQWKEKTQIRATPTILVNGYKLPENYKIEDLRYFVEAINCHPALDAGSPENKEFSVNSE